MTRVRQSEWDSDKDWAWDPDWGWQWEWEWGLLQPCPICMAIVSWLDGGGSSGIPGIAGHALRPHRNWTGVGRKWVESGSKVGQKWASGRGEAHFRHLSMVISRVSFEIISDDGNETIQVWPSAHKNYAIIIISFYEYVYAGYCVRFCYWTLIRGFDSAG